MLVDIDIIILSYAKNDHLKKLTQQTIDTLLASENPGEIKFNVLVIESNKALQPYQFPNTTTIYPTEKFGFNKYLNIGIKNTHNPYVCLCNNDLVFHKGWASEILKAMYADPDLLRATPYCSTFHPTVAYKANSGNFDAYFGVMIGWCIFVKREIFDKIGLLDEKFTFWYADNDYCQTLIKNNVKSKLITSSFVTHLGSESLKTSVEKDQQKLTQLPRIYYNYKWHHQSALRYTIDMVRFKINMLFHK
jgi:GT2 family glycosyltransferase